MKSLFLLSLLIFSTPLFAEKSRFEKLELFNKVLNLIETQYYRDIDTDKLIEGALNGMMQTLDPHSAYLKKDVFEKMQEDTQGEFGGLGIEVTEKDGYLLIISPIDDTPAYKAGIKAGDKIVEIEHESLLSMSMDKAIEKMRGKAGTNITIGIRRIGVDGIKNFTLKREAIKVNPVMSQLIDDKYLYIRLAQFQTNSAESVEAALKKSSEASKHKGGLKGIVLDLRSNPGGLLEQAVNVASIFLNEGVVVSTEARDSKNKEFLYVKKSGLKDVTTPMVVLINASSASASEIVAGALQDYKRALIVGNRSFGKGSVQTVAKIDDEKGVKLTIAQYMTPLNRKIQAIGIVPDVVVGEIDPVTGKETGEDRLALREADLRNHLTATKETPEEEKLRLEREKAERLARVKQAESAATINKNIDEMISAKKRDPAMDHQVIQAINQFKESTFFTKADSIKKTEVK